MIRRALLLIVVALAVLLVVADRLTAQAAAHALSVRARQSGQLASDPTVNIKGFPFLTQAVRGRYTEIDITTHGIHRDGLRLDTVTGRFRGVHVGLAAALDGRVSAVPIDQASGTVDVTYADLDAFLAPRRISVRAVGGVLEVSGMATAAGKRVLVAGPVQVTLTGGVLALIPTAGSLRPAAGLLPAAAGRAAAAALTVRVTLSALPFGLTLRSLAVEPTELTISAAASGLVVPVPDDAAQG